MKQECGRQSQIGAQAKYQERSAITIENRSLVDHDAERHEQAA